MAKFFEKPFFKIAKATLMGFLDDKGMKLSAALAYYTIFALAPLLLLLISLAGIFLGKDAIQGKVFEELNGLIGASAALQIQDMIKAIELSDKSTFALVIGIFTLFIGATSIFGEIQDSINIIWKVKAKPKKGWLKLLKNRLLSSSLIVSLGFLLIVSLIANGMILAMMDRLSRFLPDMTVWIANILNTAITFIVITILFGAIFKVLPDVKIKWKDVRTGAIFTACLFLIGRFLIGLYISTTATGSTFGAAGSLIVVLVWIYYTAVILYLGAEFTQVYAEYKGHHIEPADFAVAVIQKELEKDVDTLPKQHEDL
ncbi:MAG: YihY/virulence factor BrkB family protein [Saprospiraceae bacterium]|jgi:membrane protein|uniref:YihY/virulence factor BrkB family protein n=1 Tax=Candidatus Brachybacter algidus TaxID=2982024 RepID=UPI001B61B78B|nr:YihY/virulence factor BrkB family protein [Candidatus Brachybacter algidus]MBP7305825.1 YihY/virulence factor BrkB family protein [Saprospiraceae bacterium]MBK6372172.1 YihY/virulence factor BrkB family protein [Candidatus Brachybacter algidus]MBK6447580.1 YihY/virulence factor BrkB family protein [Candidatus Brachybacter algidus]MBK7603417.1 YihY/virulence factor BrkB family protein [Candidatus Brachybacter algidus]MBK8603787.1 YihY/virulence factor BrkB family protein [Candidatus Brachyba